MIYKMRDTQISEKNYPGFFSILLGGVAAAFLIVGNPAVAQQATEEEEDILVMSPFVVDESGDVGYLATNTLSGGRFNTSLRDTAASVSVFTPEWLEDLNIQDIDDLTKYSVGTVVDSGDAEPGENIIRFRSAELTVTRIRVRGITATKGLNYYTTILPDDSFRNGRYDESRGPNGILFGISNAGGIVNSSSLQADLFRDDLSLKYTFGSFNENRTEVQGNKVLIEDKLAIAAAGVYENSDGWREWVDDKRKRLYTAVAWRPTDRINIRAMAEVGEMFTRQVTPFTFGDSVLAWLDLGRGTGQPYGDSPDNIPGLADMGVSNTVSGQSYTNRNNRGNNPRHYYIENEGGNIVHNLGGTYLSSSYNDPGIPGGIEQLPGRFGGVGTLRANDPELFPYKLNLEGEDGTGRRSNFHWYQFDMDFKVTDNLYLNVGHNLQNIFMHNPSLAGSDPQVYGDPNTTLGVVTHIQFNPNQNGSLTPPAVGTPEYDAWQALIADNLNPYVGRLFVEADQRFQERVAESKETRIGISYDLITDSKWLGNHRMAAAVNQRDVIDLIEGHSLAFYGAPFDQNPTNFDNSVINRYYFDEGDFSDYRYRQTLLPYDRNATRVVTIQDIANPTFFRPANRGPIDNATGTQRTVGWVRGDGRENNRADQKIKSYLAATQSSCWDNKLVVTLGYREDRATFFDYTFYPYDPATDPQGYTVNQEQPSAVTKLVGKSKTAGVVFHLTDNFSIVSNFASSIGIPDNIRRVLPENFRESAEEVIPPPPSTSGRDYGIEFNFFDNKFNGRVVYFKTSAEDDITGGIFGNVIAGFTEDMVDSLEEALLITNNPNGTFTEAEWDEFRSRTVTDGDAMLLDTKSQGVELRLTANPTDSWRLNLNFSYTDRETTNAFKRGLPWLGYRREANGRIADLFEEIPATAGPTGNQYVYPDNLDELNLDPEGVIYQILALVPEAAAAEGVTPFEFLNFDDFVNDNRRADGGTIGELIQQDGNRQIFRINDLLQSNEQRWGLRPFKANVFTAYDFKEGFIKGFTIGGGVRWTSSNVIGGLSAGQLDPTIELGSPEDVETEFKGVNIFENDLMLRYRYNLGSDRGRVTIQFNIFNVFNDTDIIPQRLAGRPTDLVPGRGTAYTRFDVVQPRSFRGSITWDF